MRHGNRRVQIKAQFAIRGVGAAEWLGQDKSRRRARPDDDDSVPRRLRGGFTRENAALKNGEGKEQPTFKNGAN